ncbi:MAG: fibronectin type III domain-containing protein [Verrucomicrobia bacterium]|nr:fibronectin type III domain-containing protein [Verrucomicrobiota bacterium]
MASNALPNKRDRLFAQGDDMCDGAHDHEVAIDIKQNTEAVVRPALNAARAAESTFGQCQVLRKAANAALTTADNAAKLFITRSKKRLSFFLGESYSTEWGAAGWPNNSLAMPTTQDERFSLVDSLKLYLTTNPTHESTDMLVTAALALACHTTLSNARTALDLKVTESGQAKATRDAAEANLRKRMTGMITELETLLGPEDPLWHAFGLSRPADAETPEAPSFTTATAGVAGSVLVDWDDPLRADRFRVWIMVVGVDLDFRAVETVYDSDATLTGLTSGSTVKIQVTSANAAGESLPGPVAEIVVP